MDLIRWVNWYQLPMKRTRRVLKFINYDKDTLMDDPADEDYMVTEYHIDSFIWHEE